MEEHVVILKVNQEYAGIWGRLPEKQFEALKESIRVDGLLEKIKANPDLEILDGHNRFYALRELGVPVTSKMIEVVDTEKLVGGSP